MLASVDVTPADLPVWDVDGGDVPPRAWATLGELFSEDEHYEHAVGALLRSLELGLAALDPGRACMVDLHVATIAGAWGELDAAARVYGRAAARAAVLSEGAEIPRVVSTREEVLKGVHAHRTAEGRCACFRIEKGRRACRRDRRARGAR